MKFIKADSDCWKMDGKHDNYDNMDMEMSDNSDSEGFACKAEAKAIKEKLAISKPNQAKDSRHDC